jgi:hypothetical protein
MSGTVLSQDVDHFCKIDSRVAASNEANRPQCPVSKNVPSDESIRVMSNLMPAMASGVPNETSELII